jgi:hypothetical protein
MPLTLLLNGENIKLDLLLNVISECARGGSDIYLQALDGVVNRYFVEVGIGRNR